MLDSPRCSEPTPSRPARAPRAALYARVSTLRHGQDVGLQLDELRQVAQQRGYGIAAEYIDEGVSGTKESRPALNRLMADVQAGRVDILLVWKLDRLGRSLQHVLTVLATLNSAGVGFASLHDPGIDTTSPTGRLLLQILASFAQFERDLIQERVRAGVRRAQLAGKHCGRPKVELDLRPALALLNEGRDLKDTARILNLSRTTLRRRLTEAGHWPPPAPQAHPEEIHV